MSERLLKAAKKASQALERYSNHIWIQGTMDAVARLDVPPDFIAKWAKEAKAELDEAIKGIEAL